MYCNGTGFASCFGERLAEENYFTARPIAIKLSSRFTRRIFDGGTSKLIACWYLRVSTVFTKLYSLSCPAQRWSPARASGNRRLWGSKHAIAKRHFPLPMGGKHTSLPFKKLRKAPYLSLLFPMELRIA